MRRGKAVLLILTALLSTAALPAAAAEGLSAVAPWIREAPPGRTINAAYVEFRNDGDEAIVLVSAGSEGAERVEFHTSTQEDGMMRMRRVDSVEVPAHGSVTFAPGGLHLMLFGTTAPRAGTRMNIDFEYGDGDSLTVSFPVRDTMKDPVMHGTMR